MGINNLRLMNDFVKNLQDEESKKIFDARFDYFIYKDKEKFYEKIDDVLLSKKRVYSCRRLGQYYERHPENREKKVTVFGAGEGGKITCRSLVSYVGKKIDCICDNNEELNGLEYRGIPIRNFSYICENSKDNIIIVATSAKYQLEIYYQLVMAGVGEDNILMIPDGAIWCNIPHQYFDVDALQPEESGEYFIDAGCFNGETSVLCLDWCGGRLKMVYAFEPDKDNYLICNKRFQNIAGLKYELYECATWDKETVLNFDHVENAGYASSVSVNGNISVKADSIDNRLRGRKATFIKMDVEGSELETLKGAEKTILKYRPKLAISLYHKDEDIVTIPIFLERLGLGYKYYLRHYQTRMCETVLYAI